MINGCYKVLIFETREEGVRVLRDCGTLASDSRSLSFDTACLDKKFAGQSIIYITVKQYDEDSVSDIFAIYLTIFNSNGTSLTAKGPISSNSGGGTGTNEFQDQLGKLPGADGSPTLGPNGELLGADGLP